MIFLIDTYQLLCEMSGIYCLGSNSERISRGAGMQIEDRFILTRVATTVVVLIGVMLVLITIANMIA